MNFAAQTRPTGQVVLQTPSKPLGLTQSPSRQPFAYVSPLDATPMDPPASVANKGLTERLTPLDATLTKSRGVGGALTVRSAYPSLLCTLHTCHPEANRQRSLKDLTACFKLSCSLTSSALPIYRQRHRTPNGATDSFVETEDGQLITENSR